MAYESYKTKPMPQAYNTALNIIYSEMNSIATNCLIFYAEPIDARALYEKLIPPESLDTLIATSLLMRNASRYDSPTINLGIMIDHSMPWEEFPFTLSYGCKQLRTNWLWPRFMQVITPESDFGHKLIQSVDLAIQFQTSLQLLKLFISSCNNPSLIVHMLPWTKLLAQRCLVTYQGEQYAQERIALNKLLELSVPSYVPPVSSFFKTACNYGSGLITMWTLVEREAANKGIRCGETEVMVIPQIGPSYLEDGIDQHYSDFHSVMWPPETEAEKEKRQKRENAPVRF